MDKRHPELVIVAADHPSLDDAISEFGAELRAETRYFGLRGQRAARPSPALVREIVARATERGLERIVLRISHRSSDVLKAGRQLGLDAVDLGRGRVALVRQLVPQPA